MSVDLIALQKVREERRGYIGLSVNRGVEKRGIHNKGGIALGEMCPWASWVRRKCNAEPHLVNKGVPSLEFL